ncbi:MAG: hypothetical protein HKN76_05600 [Saprospiraceae bacterium]|nr:hypothetical protein [Saprospiraceae bacterium]
MAKVNFEQSVIISFNYGNDSLDPLHRLGDRLSYLLDQSDAGYYDGHELALDNADGAIFLYGRNAETVYKLIEPELDKVDWMHGAEVTLTFGSNQNAKRIEFTLEKI